MTKAIIPRAEYHDNGLLGDQTDALKHIFGQALRGFMEADVEQRVEARSATSAARGAWTRATARGRGASTRAWQH
jgi:hypothetical protein